MGAAGAAWAGRKSQGSTNRTGPHAKTWDPEPERPALVAGRRAIDSLSRYFASQSFSISDKTSLNRAMVASTGAGVVMSTPAFLRTSIG